MKAHLREEIDVTSKKALADFYNSLTDREKELVAISIEWMRHAVKGEKFEEYGDLETSREWDKMIGHFSKWQRKVYNHILAEVRNDILRQGGNTLADSNS